jgi:hypothetical protein
MSENEELMRELDELKCRVAALEERLPKVEKPYEPKEPWPRYDPTEGFRMPPSAAKPMADLIHGKGVKPDMGAWARNRMGDRGGFGPGAGGKWDKGAARVRPEEELKVPEPPKSFWSK